MAGEFARRNCVLYFLLFLSSWGSTLLPQGEKRRPFWPICLSLSGHVCPILSLNVGKLICLTVSDTFSNISFISNKGYFCS